ncbi:formin-like protein 5 isoform X4 [Senna tora]|uniref:Formin-like protein 5 isoform X4 n=1 Tax=Senna tora TaxID=362788 RepID=A0A834TXD1_9FABA|nr:formin-like protein 5 isoform X4 [Senna tora]
MVMLWTLESRHEGAEQHGGVEIESSLTQSGGSPNKELVASTGVAIMPTNNLVEVGEGEAGQVSGPTIISDNAKGKGVAFSQVPVDPLSVVNPQFTQNPSLLLNLPAPQLNLNPDHLLSLPLDGLVSQRHGAISSTQVQDLIYANPLLSQNEDFHVLQGTGLPNVDMTNNHQVSPVQNVVPNNALSGINHHPYPSYPSFFHQNPSEVGAGVGTQRQFLSNQPTPAIWNSTCGPYQQFPTVTNVYDSQYAPNYHVQRDTSTGHMAQGQQFSSMPQQGNHIPAMQKIFDVQSCMQPNYPPYARAEEYSTYHNKPAFTPMPPNPYDHQHVYKPMQPEPVVPNGAGKSMYPDYPSLPRPNAMTYDSFGAGSSNMPPRYPQLQLQDYQRNHCHTQTRITPNGFGQQGLIGSASAHLSGTGPQDLLRPPQHINITPNNASLLPSNAYEPPRITWTQKVTDVSLVPTATNTLTAAQLDKGKSVNPSSSSRPPISDGVRKILDLKPKSRPSPYDRFTNAAQIQDPDEIWIKELEKELNKAWNQPDSLINNQLVSLSRDRPPIEIEESSSWSVLMDEILQDSHEALNPLQIEGIEAQNINAPDPSAAPAREFVNTIYDKHFEKIGLPIDPHIRIFKTKEN